MTLTKTAVIRTAPRVPGPRRPVSSVAVTTILLCVMFAAGSLRYPGFFSGQVVLDIIVDNSFLVVLAVGMTFVVLTGGLDLSVGSVVGLTGVVASALLRAGWPPGVVIVVMIAVGMTVGLLVGLVIQYFEIEPFIATLVAMFLVRGLCYVLSPQAVAIHDGYFVAVAQTQIPIGLGLLISPGAIVSVLFVVMAALVLRFTRFGRTVYAVGGRRREAAVLMGLAANRTRVLVYVISGFSAGVAGVLFSFYTLSGDSGAGMGMELDAIAAVVIGGTVLTGGRGYVLGSLLGVLVLGMISTLISFDGTLSTWWASIITGALLLTFVLLQRLLVVRAR